MRRALVALSAAALAVVPLAPARAQSPARALDASARASVLFAQIDVQPAFDPAWADSRAASSTIGASSLNSAIWPSFLVDAFFFLYGFQSVERLALGIAEARYPQGPEEVDATQSNLLFLNVGDPDMVPGRFGRAYALAKERRASGDVATGWLDLPGLGRVAASASQTTASTVSVSESSARQEVTGIAAGPLTIDAVLGEASTTIADHPQARASLTIVGAEVAGTPVEITDEGVHAATSEAQTAVDDALAGSGLSVRLLPSSEETDDEAASASSGGLLVVAEVEAEDPTGAQHSIVLGYLLGAAEASARAATVGSLPSEPPSIDTPPRVIRELITIPGVAPSLGPPAAGTRILRRTIITTAAGEPIGARGAYAAVMLLGIGLLLVRPLVRAAARA